LGGYEFILPSMNDEQQLRKTAKKVEKKLAAGSENIPLDQPFPEDLPPTSGTENEVSQVAETPPVKEPVKKKKEDKATEDEPDKEPTVGNYKLSDILKVPIEPPTPVKTEGYKATSNNKVLFLVAVGVILCLLGVFLAIIANFFFGAIFVVLGMAAILLSVFAPLG
jgi:hypothetical protein